jgi:malonyl-CoA O-methyltransferase
MLQVARRRLSDGAQWIEADFVDYTGFSENQFDALVTSLVIEHIKDLNAFFKRAAAVLKPGASCYISEIHPLKAAAGSRANFKDPQTGQNTYLDSYPHSSEAIEGAAHGMGFRLQDTEDVIGDQTLANLNPEWSRYLGKPMIKIWIFQAPN